MILDKDLFLVYIANNCIAYMRIKRQSFIFILLLITPFIILFQISPIYANTIDRLVDKVKSFVSNDPKELSIKANIALAENGDENSNGEIDSGDVVTFSYTITNTTDQEYSYTELDTHVPRDYLHFIHNIRGTVNLNDNSETIKIPNLTIHPQQLIEISFDARINYTEKEDLSISTEPEIIASDKRQLLKAKKEEIKAKKLEELEGIFSNIESIKSEKTLETISPTQTIEEDNSKDSNINHATNSAEI